MFEYFWIGMKTMWEGPVFSFAFYLLTSILLLIFWRRFIIVRRSGGNFFAPFHIANGRLYIHNAFAFVKRIIPLNNIKRIEVKYIRSVKLNGVKYLLCIEQKDRKTLSFFFGKSKQNDMLVKNLKNETKNYHIRIVSDR
ncbi:hypothetical protein HMPREF9184_01403 [Streptococcus sp. oral taxon 058 str. F0407]|uniref:hypothetical protein n=1 Tax=Streptococcus sp. oral taxon 058 TaxID=712622 RepID=UPI000234AE11|nr:hypothetical protein [Streptococcus sp. oral taxon 058]EHI76310.1 hypothetical protein HMPREF9184_01403 [Streptococcus sp. oral taxon 058 str. F0407]